MKKYDFILGGLYILPIVLGFMLIYALKNPSRQRIKKAEAYFEELYKQPLKTVKIQNTNMAIRVRQKPEKGIRGFKLTGALSVNQISSFRVNRDTLFIENNNRNCGTSLDLWVAPEVKVDTLNAPWVNISPEKVEGKTVDYGF